MSWDIVLAKEFRKRENQKLIGACLGTVTSVKPFGASILDGQILLDASNCYVCNGILERESKFTLTGTQQSTSISIEGEIKLDEVLKRGDMVLVLPAADEQTFFIIDIVKGVE